MGRIWRFGKVEFATATVISVVLLLVVLAAGYTAPALQRTVIEALIDLVVVVGLYIFVGNSGVVSFGHVSFMAIGGYASAILTMTAQKKHVLLQLPRLPRASAAALLAGRGSRRGLRRLRRLARSAWPSSGCAASPCPWRPSPC